ncbi:MAG: ribonuclease [Chitinophagaceae bacterium]|nr:ribonuclease [Chitinophagaceae bacterium]MDB5222305.1 ribonuclease [Chitinophagaceae bacterium]
MLLPFFHNKFCEAGLDEAGRGCFAGPVFAAAVILPKDFYHPALNDSKQMKREDREMLRPIIEKECISYSVAKVDNEEIDRINILQASFKAMHISLNRLKHKPEYLLIDGNRFKKYKDYPHRCVIQGDGIYTSIAAASVLAKTYRDEYMQKLHKKYKMYSWETNKGYGTPEHRSAIEKHGLCKYHRMSFNILAAKPSEVHDDEIAEELQTMQPIPQVPDGSPAIHLSYNLSQ